MSVGQMTDAELTALAALLYASAVQAAANNQVAAARGEPGGYMPDGTVQWAVIQELQVRKVLR